MAPPRAKIYTATTMEKLRRQLVGAGIFPDPGPCGTFVDKEIPKLLAECIAKAGIPERWNSLRSPFPSSQAIRPKRDVTSRMVNSFNSSTIIFCGRD